MTRPDVFLWLGDDLAMRLLRAICALTHSATQVARQSSREVTTPVDGGIEEWQIRT
jgi:hypothetical protein